MNSYQKIISIDSKVYSGKPCVRNLRITVADVLGNLAVGMKTEKSIMSESIKPSNQLFTMNKYCYLILLMLTCLIGQSQNLISNGDFEINNASTCSFNLPNNVLNSTISSCFAFGLQSEIDLQDTSCSASPYFGDIPAHGHWFISLASQINSPDGLSLFLNSTLVAGNTYFLSYFEKADTILTNYSLDSVLVGVSSDSSIFGTQIYSSLPNPLLGWTNTTFTFTSPVTGKYVTFSNKAGQIGWNFIDNVCVSTDSLMCFTEIGLTEFKEKEDLFFFPNPFNDVINIKTNNNELLRVSLYDITARKILTQSFTNSTTLNTNQFAKGIYFYEVDNIKGVSIKGKIVKE